MGVTNSQSLRALAASPRMCGKNNALLAAADTIDALTEKALIVEADANVHIDRLIGERDEARVEVARLRDALTFYADTENYHAHHDMAVGWQSADIIEDQGARARAALGEGT